MQIEDLERDDQGRVVLADRRRQTYHGWRSASRVLLAPRAVPCQSSRLRIIPAADGMITWVSCRQTMQPVHAGLHMT